MAQKPRGFTNRAPTWAALYCGPTCSKTLCAWSTDHVDHVMGCSLATLGVNRWIVEKAHHFMYSYHSYTHIHTSLLACIHAWMHTYISFNLDCTYLLMSLYYTYIHKGCITLSERYMMMVSSILYVYVCQSKPDTYHGPSI